MSYRSRPVRLAVVSGPAYDPLYEHLARSGVACEIGFRGDHPSLNRHLASFGAELPYEVVSTHTKYAPAQAAQLAPLDELIAADALADFVPRLLELARVSNRLLGLPRNLDARLLHYRTDLTSLPATWDALFDTSRRLKQSGLCATPFVFPGMESGLFGTFYELCEMAGAELFPADGGPRIQNAGGEWALELLRTCVHEGLAPSAAKGWHYDRVHEYFRAGHAAFVGDWPGYYAFYRDRSQCPVSDRIALAPYPLGPAGKSLAYAGAHTFALTHAGARSAEALRVLQFLTAPEQQSFEARRGFVPVRMSVMAEIQAESSGAELERLRALQTVSQHQVVIPPKLAVYPEIEDTIWHHVQDAIFGDTDVKSALAAITSRIETILRTS